MLLIVLMQEPTYNPVRCVQLEADSVSLEENELQRKNFMSNKVNKNY